MVTPVPITNDIETHDLLIVSAFGRGHWLAFETASRGWRVCLVDVTKALLGVQPGATFADGDGPFGLFEAGDLTKSQRDFEEADPATLRLKHGFTLWTRRGPLEFRSPLTEYCLNAQGISVEVDRYIRGTEASGRERARRSLIRKPFAEAWLAHFAHSFASTEYSENFSALNTELAAPLFARFSIRHTSGGSHEEQLKTLEDAGVRVRRDARVTEFTTAGSRIDAVSVEDIEKSPERARNFVYLLSATESRLHAPAVAKVVFPQGSVAPDWTWRRSRYSIENFAADQLPSFAVAIEDSFLPWSHANTFIIKKAPDTTAGLALDIWSKWPAASEARMNEIEAVLKRRFPGAGFRLAHTAPPSLGVYDRSTLKALSTSRAPNLFFGGPEAWPSGDRLGQYRIQNRIFYAISKLKDQWDAALAKRLQKEVAP